MTRIKKIGIFQTSKVVAILLFLSSVVFIIPMGLFSAALGRDALPGMPFEGSFWFFILIPFLYGIISFVITALSCFLYNLVAKWTGGIEFKLEKDEG